MNYKDHLLYPLYLNYAQRSLLGGGKGSFVMDELKLEDPQFHDFVMTKAKEQMKDKTNLSNEAKLQEMRKLMKANINNIYDATEDILNKEGEK